MQPTNQSARISPTAYVTGYFWYTRGMSHPALATGAARRLYYASRPLVKATQLLSGLSLDATLLARHQGIDAFLDAEISAGRVGQIIEIAAGLSPRGLRFAGRYGEGITYLETDLPGMADNKRELLGRAGLRSAKHSVVALDALATDGPLSLRKVTKGLDPTVGTAIVTEGLINYLDAQQAGLLWTNIASVFAGFTHGLYVTDAHFRSVRNSPAVRVAGHILSGFVRGRMHMHFDDATHAQQLLTGYGFDTVTVRQAIAMPANNALVDPAGAKGVQVITANTCAGGHSV